MQNAVSDLCLFTGKLSFEDHVDFVMTLLSACVLNNYCEVRAFHYSSYIKNGLCGLDIVLHYLRTPSLGRAPHQTATSSVLSRDLFFGGGSFPPNIETPPKNFRPRLP